MKTKYKLSSFLLFVALVMAILDLAMLVYNFKFDVFTDMSFYILCVVVIALIVAFFLTFLNRKNNKYIETLENRLGLWNTISYKVKGAGENAFNELPIGVIVLDNHYKVKWSNAIVQSMVLSSLKDKNLKEIANGKLYDFVNSNEGKKFENNRVLSTIELFHKIYKIEYLTDIRVIYLRDITEFAELKTRYKNRTVAVGYINIDNLEEALSDLDVQGKSECQGKIMAAIVKWAESFGTFVRAFSDSKFMLMTDYSELIKMMDDNFSILDDIKLLLKTTKAVHVTLSMGIVCEDLPIDKLSLEAEDLIELALNRGGDQAIVKLNGKTTFYGAKTEPTRKESKTQIRYNYQKLEDIINESGTVFCMGHTYQDADAFGSTIAMYNLAIALGKKAFIILDEDKIDATVKKVYDDVKKYHKVLHKVFITPEKAVEMYKDGDLLMIVDCQAESQIFLTPKQKAVFKKIGIIDHHRKNDAGTIANPAFYYCEPAASSCVEVIFTLLEFSSYELRFSDYEATWMLLGMVVDTNNFTYRSSDITFEIAAKLAKQHASMGKVKEYLKEKKEEKLLRNKLIADIECYHNNVAIAVQTDNAELESATLAKVSDELLSIEGFILAVTCGYTYGGGIKLSARSLGKVNCQVLMEKLGGGGHLTAAATVIKEATMDEVIARLKAAIDEILKEDDYMKVILKSNIKGKGKKGDVVELGLAQAKVYIANEQAIEATTENMRLLEQEKHEEEAEEEKKRNEYRLIKSKIEARPIVIEVLTSEDGSILDLVNAKVIAHAVEKVIKTKVDKRKIMFNSNVTALGLYEAQYQLHKDIFATITIHVVEKKIKNTNSKK